MTQFYAKQLFLCLNSHSYDSDLDVPTHTVQRFTCMDLGEACD